MFLMYKQSKLFAKRNYRNIDVRRIKDSCKALNGNLFEFDRTKSILKPALLELRA